MRPVSSGVPISIGSISGPDATCHESSSTATIDIRATQIKVAS
jgi:hypothetical protein